MEQMQPQPTRQSVWETNPNLKILLLVLIVVFLFSGIGLVVFSQVQSNNREKVYEETQAGLPKHEVKEVPAATTTPISQATPKDWKVYKNTDYGFQFSYPPTNYKFQSLGFGTAPSVNFVIPFSWAVPEKTLGEGLILSINKTTEQNSSFTPEIYAQNTLNSLKSDANVIKYDGTDTAEVKVADSKGFEAKYHITYLPAGGESLVGLGIYRQVFFEHGGAKYLIQYYSKDKGSDEVDQLLNKIIQSIRFTK